MVSEAEGSPKHKFSRISASFPLVRIQSHWARSYRGGWKMQFFFRVSDTWLKIRDFITMEEKENRQWGTANSFCHVLQEPGQRFIFHSH